MGGHDEFGASRNYIIPRFIHNIEQAPVLVRNTPGGALFILEEHRTRTPAWEAWEACTWQEYETYNDDICCMASRHWMEVRQMRPIVDVEIIPSPTEVSVPERITILYPWGPLGCAQVGRGLNDLRGIDYDNSIAEHPRRRERADGGSCSYRRRYQANEFDSYIFHHG
uniref:Uncharacterized protein n=1 Tax=Chromera velia CCMP2878 TaxID=1169474 RepID=A0A0G4F090_9ALVE|eukprot:Cvel_14471.t1-p1 / transcript=Cvel_14471.t1 / gene=Cvel_14471 / organism=Chromera_velia_CCMP2878 / gene_product=hypothetical protein / transcript_product=hypothetical protein / location=Cvel_scaffold1031:7151-7651(+) / protein_length=167 / sequence_SO=supercontig / SO=protein_coding / is_pseudo=false